MSILEYDNTNKSLNNIYIDIPPNNCNNRLRQRRSLDYGRSGFILAGPNRQKSFIASHHQSIPSSPSHNNNSYFLSSSSIPKSQIRRQSSERCLIKRHSVDSNKSNISDPGFSLINNKNYAGSNFLIPSQQRSPKDSSSPRSYHSSAASVTGRQASYASISVLSRQSSVNSSNIIGKQQSSDNLDNRKWFSSSSVILTRVKSMKDKFRRVVVQSVQPDDWPPPSILFSERYRYPSLSSCQSGSLSTGSKSAQIFNREAPHLVKSKSIDQSSFPSSYNNNNNSSMRKPLRNTNSVGSARQFKRGKLQRSNTSYSSTNDPLEHISNNDSGIVCTDLDLKAIINNFKREETCATMNGNSSIQDKLKLTANISKTPTATSSVMGPGFGKRKLMRKQVSFDDEQGVMMINRKVSAIAEEIESHAPIEYERRSSLTIGPIDSAERKSTDKFPHDKQFIKEITKEDEDENSAPEDADSLALLPILPKEIEFDEFGQTWEIYGADPDPEILGQAIQTHLERLMICRQSISLANGNANMSKSKLSDTGHGSKIEIPKRILKPLRVDLESSENHLRLLARRLCGKWSCFSDNRQQSNSSKFVGINQKITVSVDHES